MTTLGPVPQGKFQPVDGNGVPYANGTVGFYIPATLTDKTTWRDYQGVTPNVNPVALDSNGRALIFGSGNYRQILKDSLGNTIWDIVIGDPVADALAQLTAALALLAAAVPVGQMVPYGGATAPSTWLLCYGQAVSRATYALLFTAIGTTFGAGDGMTTFNVPDLRGRAAFGQDDMGGPSAGRVTTGVSGIDGATVGASGGNQAQQAHSHTLFTQSDGTTTYNQVLGTGGAQSGFLTPFTTTATSGAANPVYAGNTGAGGSQNMPPTLITNYIIYAGV